MKMMGTIFTFFMQFFMFTKNYEFWHDEVCLDLVDGNPDTKVKLYTCHGLGGNQKWEHEKASYVLIIINYHRTDDIWF